MTPLPASCEDCLARIDPSSDQSHPGGRGVCDARQSGERASCGTIEAAFTHPCQSHNAGRSCRFRHACCRQRAWQIRTVREPGRKRHCRWGIVRWGRTRGTIPLTVLPGYENTSRWDGLATRTRPGSTSTRYARRLVRERVGPD
jgi:hypothetical protein